MLERQGLLVRDAESDYLDFEPGEALDQLIGAGFGIVPAFSSESNTNVMRRAAITHVRETLQALAPKR